MLHARPVAAFAETLLVAKQFCNFAHHGGDLVLLHECIQAHPKMRIGGEPPPTRTENPTSRPAVWRTAGVKPMSLISG